MSRGYKSTKQACKIPFIFPSFIIHFSIIHNSYFHHSCFHYSFMFIFFSSKNRLTEKMMTKAQSFIPLVALVRDSTSITLLMTSILPLRVLRFFVDISFVPLTSDFSFSWSQILSRNRGQPSAQPQLDGRKWSMLIRSWTPFWFCSWWKLMTPSTTIPSSTRIPMDQLSLGRFGNSMNQSYPYFGLRNKKKKKSKIGILTLASELARSRTMSVGFWHIRNVLNTRTSLTNILDGKPNWRRDGLSCAKTFWKIPFSLRISTKSRETFKISWWWRSATNLMRDSKKSKIGL